MRKLMQLEERLIKAKEQLSKMMGSSSSAPGSVNTTGGPSIASQIGFGKAEKKHPDEKEDKKLIAEAMDRHNEQKHGEPKNEDSAKKAMKLNKTEEISYLPNGQWSLEKARILHFPSGRLLADTGAPARTTPPAAKGKLWDTEFPPPFPSEEATSSQPNNHQFKEWPRFFDEHGHIIDHDDEDGTTH